MLFPVIAYPLNSRKLSRIGLHIADEALSSADQITTDLWWNLPCREHKPPVRTGRLVVARMGAWEPVANFHAGNREAGIHTG